MPQNCTHKQQFSETDFPNHLPTSSAKTLNYIHHHILYSSSIQSFRPFYRAVLFIEWGTYVKCF